MHSQTIRGGFKQTVEFSLLFWRENKDVQWQLPGSTLSCVLEVDLWAQVFFFCAMRNYINFQIMWFKKIWFNC